MPRPSKFHKNEILDKALELFWDRPLKDIHLQDIEAHTGLKRSNLYDHFENKEDLFEQAFIRYRESCIRQILDLLLNQKTVYDGYKILFYRLIEFLTNPETNYRFPDPRVVLNRKQDNHELIEHLRLDAKTIQKIFKEALRIGIRKGEFAKQMDLNSMSALMFTLYDGIITNSMLDNDSDDLQSMADSILGTLKQHMI